MLTPSEERIETAALRHLRRLAEIRGIGRELEGFDVGVPDSQQPSIKKGAHALGIAAVAVTRTALMVPGALIDIHVLRTAHQIEGRVPGEGLTDFALGRVPRMPELEADI